MKRLFDKEFLKEVLWEDAEGTEILLDEQVDTSRWSSHHRLVFSFEGRFWEVDYSQGLSETQDERPFEYSPDQVEAQEVELYQKIVTDYRPVVDKPL